jgi:gliding motility-associated-like protein
MFRRLTLLICFCITWVSGYGQIVTECPANIGFEAGTLNNWVCSAGFISQTGGMAPGAPRPATISLDQTGPLPGQHTIVKRGSGKDYYGQFSLDAPNGSGYVVQLGNEINGRGAERISYTINVPANVDNYSVIFNYAVVFENPDHDYDEQPKFTASVFDLSSNASTACGSFEFVSQGGLPGFQISPFESTRPNNNPGNNNQPASILYKPWSPVLVNLTDYRGRTVRLEFTTNDCSRGGHFGYAYIDFNENCSIPIIGNITCPETSSITLRTLPGFFAYRWYNVITSETLGIADSVVISPVLPIGTRVGVELVPYAGLGCTQTLFTTVARMAMNIIDPPPDCVSVDLTDIALKVGNSSDISYSYWMDERATVRLVNPQKVTIRGTYYIKGTSSSGCVVIKPVKVNIIEVPPIVLNKLLQAVYPGTVDLANGFIHERGVTYTYWLDARATVPLTEPSRIGKRGTYYVKAVTAEGCVLTSPIPVDILIPDIVVPSLFTPNNDGANDQLPVLINSNVRVKYFKIFNRWGEVVYITSDINNYWTGFKDTSQVPVGVYYWVIEGIRDSKRYVRSGYFTLMR